MIFTFYSYKGGVGRSMALANVAEYFYLRGLRVAMVDWDLEAPGLENYFYAPDPEEVTIQSLFTGGTEDKAPPRSVLEVQSRLGLIDMLLDYRRAYPNLTARQTEPGAPSSAVPQSFEQLFQMSETASLTVVTRPFAELLEQSLPPINQYLHPIHAPQPDKPGGLWLLAAGWRALDRFPVYAKAVQDFDWEDFYISFEGKAYFDWMRAQLTRVADVVLIDSRTGVTEMGGVCASQMADVVVSFCAPNTQNLEGVSRMITTFTRPDIIEARDKRPLESVVVPARVENKSEERLLNEFRLLFRSRLETREKTPQAFQNVNTSQWELQIPYVPKYAFGEKLVIGKATDLNPEQLSQLNEKEREERLKAELERALELEKAYTTLALHLALLAPEGHALRRSMREELRKNFPALYPQVCLSYVDPAAAPLARELHDFLEQHGLSLWPHLEHTSSASVEDNFDVIAKTASLVVMITKGSATSDVLRRELRYAREQGKCCWLVPDDERAQGPLPPWLESIPLYLGASGRQRLLADLQRPCGALRAPLMTPPLPERHVDRDQESKRLKTLLLESAAAPGVTHCALWGLAGSGKSVLLAVACQDGDVIDAFPGGILWVTLGPAPDIPGCLNAVCTALAGQSETTLSLADALTRLHSRLSNRNFLMAIDDVWDVAHLDAFRSFGDRCTRVITTRDVDIATAINARTITVGELTTDESVRLLTASMPGVSGSNTSVEHLVEGLQPIAQTVTLARGALEQLLAQGQTPDAVLGNLQRRLDLHGIAAFDQAEATERTQSITKSLNASLERLRPWERRRLIQLAAAYQGNWVSTREVLDLWAREADEKDELREIGETRFGPRQADKLVQRLCALSFTELNEQEQKVRVHPLIALFLQSQSLVVAKNAPPAQRTAISSASDRARNEDAEQARSILKGQATTTPQDLIALARTLAKSRYFGYARRIQALARRLVPTQQDPGPARKLAQKHALYTYKDKDLPSEQRFEMALDILRGVDDLLTTRDQETLGLAGAICKNQWEYDAQIQNLERSLGYYHRGYRVGIRSDGGYTAINAAFVLDLMAGREEADFKESGDAPSGATARREQARTIRREIIATLTPMLKQKETADLSKDYWFLATIGEAYFGLGLYDEAAYWLREAASQAVEDWQAESTARQLAALACTQGGTIVDEQSPAWKALRVFLLNDSSALRSIRIGKVGLALSGGGFRASLFHIGVLARLAEFDALRHIEVLSCVSGGSIIGAHYYLEVRHLLQTKSDEEITRQNYIDLVKRIEHDFLSGVQRNLRTRVLAEWTTNLKTLFKPGYSRTERLAELYEKELYARIQDENQGRQSRWLNELLIEPKGAASNFMPKLDNWRRSAKVPQLVLNATTLNTGHNWQFTASFMGEPPSGVNQEVDGNERLRRMYYWEAPRAYTRFRLGRAVAASACVPGLFEPLEMQELFPNRTLQLVDGGVHDNQGVGSLLEQECTVLLVSDASGQMGSKKNPSQEALEVPMRANSILQARVREAEYRELQARRKSQLLRGLMFVHLKKDLGVSPVDWVDCTDPGENLNETSSPERLKATSYGVFRELQEKLAAIRTDLDSFSDQEAYTLMWSGYRMTDSEFRKSLGEIPVAEDSATGWQFQQIEPVATRTRPLTAKTATPPEPAASIWSRLRRRLKLALPQPHRSTQTPDESAGRTGTLEAAYARLLRGLDVGRSRGLKVWRLSPWLPTSLLLLVLGCIAAAVPGRRALPSGLAVLLTERLLAAVVIGGLLLIILIYFANRAAGRHKPFSQLLTGAVMAGGGFILARLHLWFFDAAFLNQGRVGSPRIPVWRRVAALAIVLSVLGAGVHFLRSIPDWTR